MKLTNQEIVIRLNSIIAFINKETESGKAMLSAKGEYAVIRSKDILLNAYRPYEETVKKITGDEEGIKELLSKEVEVADFEKITKEDFKDGITSEMIMLIGFMCDGLS